eukprot:gb/GECG01002280.1/.p1 GENE.gb/GECG01002280.1/~~gb/GECG01002280.1/.p1  ORF type:complete len:455 (+),score=92.30 gb/GECG01002280.1/:1-1365(+)
MPPKKKDKKKGGKKEKKEEEVQPTEFDNYTTEELEETIRDYEQRLDKAQRDRNQIQIDRDTVQSFFDVTKEELEEIKLATLAKDREIESAEENHKAEVRVYSQKVRHLEYEHSNNMREIDEAAQEEYKGEDQYHDTQIDELRKKKISLKEQLSEQENAHAEEVQSLKSSHDKYIYSLRQAFDKHMSELNGRYQERLDKLIHDLELRRKVELHEVEERKNEHINDLIRNHERQFTKMKDFYNDITRKNLKTISDLKSQIKDMNEKQVANQSLMVDIAEENKRLADPLTVATAEVQSLKADLRDAEKDRLALKNARARHKGLAKEIHDLRNKHDQTEAEYEKLEKERDELYSKFEDAIRTVQDRVEFRNKLLEQKLDAIAEEHENKSAQLQEVISAAELDPSALEMVNERLDSILGERSRMLKDLQYQVGCPSRSQYLGHVCTSGWWLSMTYRLHA